MRLEKELPAVMGANITGLHKQMAKNGMTTPFYSRQTDFRQMVYFLVLLSACR